MENKKEWERIIIDDIKKILDNFPEGNIQDFEGPIFSNVKPVFDNSGWNSDMQT